jgi:hypothetical protein
MCRSWRHYCHSALLAILRKKIGEPKKEIRKLNGFEYRYLNGLNVPYYSSYPLLSIKVISMGMTLFPSRARLTLPLMNKQKLDPKNSTYDSLEHQVEKIDQRKK